MDDKHDEYYEYVPTSDSIAPYFITMLIVGIITLIGCILLL